MTHYHDRILAVDDNPDNLLILQELLAYDHTLMSVGSGEQALEVAPTFKPDLVLLDVLMPGLDGVATCRALRSLPEMQGSRIVMLSAKNELNDRLIAYQAGAVDYMGKPFDHSEVAAKVEAWMHVVRRDLVEKIWQEAEVARQAVGAAMVNLASFRDTETGDHLFRVRWYAQSLAEELGRRGPYRTRITSEFCANLYRASPLHDIGKVAVDDAILRKPGPLTSQEFEAMKKHTIVGADLLRTAFRKLPMAKYLELAAEIARHHHERYDGSGYPDRLAGDAIPLSARILAVADVFDALTSKRVYKDAVSVPEAARIIREESGDHFDPAVVEAFETRLAEFQQARTRFSANCATYDPSLLPAEALFGTGTGIESLSFASGL